MSDTEDGVLERRAMSLPTAVPVVIVGDTSAPLADEEGDDENGEVDVSPFFNYLNTDRGHEIAQGVLGIFQDIKKAALGHTAGQAKLEKLMQLGIVATVIGAATTLAALGKMDATMGVLFGTMVGYVFGRK